MRARVPCVMDRCGRVVDSTLAPFVPRRLGVTPGASYFEDHVGLPMAAEPTARAEFADEVDGTASWARPQTGGNHAQGQTVIYDPVDGALSMSIPDSGIAVPSSATTPVRRRLELRRSQGIGGALIWTSYSPAPDPARSSMCDETRGSPTSSRWLGASVTVVSALRAKNTAAPG